METRAVYKLKIGTPDDLTRCILEGDKYVETLEGSIAKDLRKGRVSGLNPKPGKGIIIPRLIGIYQTIEPVGLDYREVDHFKSEFRERNLEDKRRLEYEFGIKDEINANLICLVHEPNIIEKSVIETYLKDGKSRIKIARYSELPDFDAKDTSVIDTTFETLKKMLEGGVKREAGMACIKYNLGTLEEQFRDYGLTTIEFYYFNCFRNRVQSIVTPSSFETEIVELVNTLANRFFRR